MALHKQESLATESFPKIHRVRRTPKADRLTGAIASPKPRVVFIDMRYQKGMSRFLWLYHAAVRRFTRYSFPFWQQLGIHVTPVHYYQPVPDTRMLPDSVWERHSEAVGVDFNEPFQLALLEEFSGTWRREYEAFPRERGKVHPQRYYVNNGRFVAVDGEVLYCMIRKFRPRRIIEIGSGFSTLVAAQAVIRNQEDYQQACELVACDPHPVEFLTSGFPGLTQLVQKRVEELPVSFFAELSANDILFIDSSHVLRIGGDVQYEFLDVIPRVAKGVLVHIHDIFLPAEYLRKWVKNYREFFSEQYLLQAFLTFNKAFRVVWAASYLHLHHPDRLEAAFCTYKRTQQWPGSFWFQRVE